MRKPPIRLGIFATHPIQYFAPLWRLLAEDGALDLCVYFFSDHSIRGGVDPEFGVKVAWDVPLVEGYTHRFVTRDADLARPSSVSLPAADRFLRAEQLDVVLVHGYMHRFERQVIRAARKAGLGTCIRGEFTDASPSRGRSVIRSLVRDAFLRRFYQDIDAFCCIGVNARHHLRRLRVPDERVFDSPYSVDTELVDRQRLEFPRDEARRNLGIPAGAVAVLFTGKLIARKAPLLLLEAIRRLPSHDNVVLLLVGEGDQRSDVVEVATSALGERVRAPGFVNQGRIGQYYSAADVFVLPSLYDSWGLVVNEAMQFGLPAIVSDRVGCAPDLIVEGRTGFTFRSEDPQDLADRLALVLGDAELRKEMGRNAARHIGAYSTRASAEGVRRAVLSTAKVPRR